MMDGGGGTLGGPQASDGGHLFGDLQQPAVAGRGRCPTGFAGAPPPLPRAGRRGMRWGLDVAAPPASRLVRSGPGGPRAASLPGHAGPAGGRAGPGVCAAGTQASEPRPGPGATPGPAPVWALLGWARNSGFRVLRTLGAHSHDTRLPALLVGFGGPLPVLLKAMGAALESWPWASVSPSAKSRP